MRVGFGVWCGLELLFDLADCSSGSMITKPIIASMELHRISSKVQVIWNLSAVWAQLHHRDHEKDSLLYLTYR